jgi:cobalt-zinc-cadmium resistance protein CzcA
MLNSIIYFSIKNKFIVLGSTLLLIIVGIYSLIHLPIDAVPDITNNQVQIITTSPSLAAPEVERLITFPIETNTATIPGILEVRSISRFGLSVVTVVFEDDVDVYWARQQVNERLTQIITSLPKGIGIPYLAPVSTGLSEIYQYILRPKKGYENKYDASSLRTIQDWYIRRNLLGTKGVADISSFGGHVKQYEIAIQPQKLQAMGISIQEVFDALSKNNQNTGGAYIDKNPNAWFIRSEGLIKSLEDIRNIVVKDNNQGTPIFIQSIAEVKFGKATRYGAMTYNNEGEVVGAIVLMLKGENSNEVIKNVKERIAIIEKGLPEGLMIDVFLDRTHLVNRAIETVSKNLVEGALIVIFVLVLFLGNIRAGLIVASVIPLSMLFAICLMNVFGVSGNLMSLGSIDFGIIVDGAVIIVEATLHHIYSNKKYFGKTFTKEEFENEVYQSASAIRTSAAFGEMIILIVYLPILALVGIEGKMFGPMAQTVSFAILGAFLLSLTYVPMMSAWFLSKKVTHEINWSEKWFEKIQIIYQYILSRALNHSKLILMSTLLIAGSSIYIFSKLGGEFIPTLDEGDFAVEVRLLPGSSLSKTIEVSLKAGELLKKEFVEVDKVVGKIGSSEIPTDPMPIEACDLMIILKDKSEWKNAESKDELAEKMMALLNQHLPGVSLSFQQPIQMRFNELMTGAKQDVAIKIQGEDFTELTKQSLHIHTILNGIEGVKDIYLEKIAGLQQIVVDFDRNLLAQHHVSIEQANNIVRTAFAGEVTGQVYENEKKFDLVVRLDSSSRNSIDDVQNLLIYNVKGQAIPLNQIARVELKEGFNQIQREDGKRKIIVGFNVRERDVESIVNEIEQKLDKSNTLKPGYTLSIGGQFKNLIEAKERLSIVVPIALLLIFIMLYITFKSFMQSILIFSAIPFSAIGGIIALALRDMPFSISAGIGFIALFGVAVLNGIVLIAVFNKLKIDSQKTIVEIIKEGTTTRLRPVLMTATVASLGFLPMALSHGAGAEVQKPLATVVIGGLITATLLTLIVLPILYLKLSTFKSKK